MKLISFLTMCLISIPAFSAQTNNGCQGNCPTEGGGTQTQQQGQLQGQAQLANSTSSAGALAASVAGSSAVVVSTPTLSSTNRSEAVIEASTSVSNGGNQQNISTGGVSVVTTYPKQYKNTPNAYPTSLEATAPCMGSSSGAASGAGFGVSFGSTWESKECQIRETVRTFAGLGLKEDAIRVLCSSEIAKVAPICSINKE